MYGKATRLRLGKETQWGVVPAGGWTQAAAIAAKVSAAARVAAQRGKTGAAVGVAYGTAKLEVVPGTANLAALADAGLKRGALGEADSYTFEVADAAGARRVRGALVRRFKARAGVARPALEFAYEAVGKLSEECAAFDAGAASGTPFVFGGSACLVDAEAVALKEFSISVNNNTFLGPAGEDGLPSFATAGRQDVTGYLVTGTDRRDLVDGGEHAVAITMSGDGASARIEAEVFFTWCREIRSAAAGALQVLYFEGAAGGLGGAVSIALE